MTGRLDKWGENWTQGAEKKYRRRGRGQRGPSGKREKRERHSFEGVSPKV